jgi:hypothetical protein
MSSSSENSCSKKLAPYNAMIESMITSLMVPSFSMHSPDNAFNESIMSFSVWTQFTVPTGKEGPSERNTMGTRLLASSVEKKNSHLCVHRSDMKDVVQRSFSVNVEPFSDRLQSLRSKGAFSVNVHHTTWKGERLDKKDGKDVMEQ